LVVCTVTVLFNLINLLNTPREGPDFSIANNLEIKNSSETVFNTIDELENMTGIRNIELITYYNNFLIKKNEAKLSFPIYTAYDENGSVDCHHISIRVLTDEQLEVYKKDNEDNTDGYKAENHILLSKNIAFSKYKIGDEISIYDNPINESRKSFTIAGFIDVPQNGESLFVYVTKENFEKIVGQPAIPNVINVYVDDAADIPTIRENINDIFKDKNLFDIMDNIKIRQDWDVLYKGLLIMVNFLCSVLFMCAMILLWAFIAFYISNQKPQIYILKILGATKKVIWNITIYEAFIKGIINSLAGLIIGTFISDMVIKMGIYDLLINKYLFITYGLIIIITILAHILPSFITIRKMTAENVKVKEN
jgi:ABC-type lipoprotein release transport system permease subunit